MPQYFRGIFHSCMGTMDMLFTSVINLVWKLQDKAKQLEKWGVLLGLGCLFLFSGILFLDPQNPFLSGFLRISFFLISFFLIFSEEFLHRNVVLEGSWWRVLENACFQPLSEDFFARIPAGQKFLYLHRIPPDSSGFLWIPPDSCSRQNLSGLDQQLKKTLC